jgi:hypothetical protein
MSDSPSARGRPGSPSLKPLLSPFASLGSRPKSIAEQYEAASRLASADDASVEDLYKITWGQRRFVIGSLLDRRKSRGRRSWIGNDGWFLAELRADSTSSGDIWCCRLCDDKGAPQFFNAQSTSSAQVHLRKSALRPPRCRILLTASELTGSSRPRGRRPPTNPSSTFKKGPP